MAVGKISEFDMDCGNWSSYAERLEMYFKVNGVKDELKLPTLITTMGDRAYELLTDLASPRKPAEMTFKEASDLLQQHLNPKPSFLAERFVFRQRKQKADENISCYVAVLKKLAKNCEFGENLQENLRDQFICGIREDGIRQQLFAKGSITFKESVAMAVSFESAVRDAAVVEGPSCGASAGGRALAGAHSADVSYPDPRSRLSAGRLSLGGDDAVHNLQIGGCFACGDFRHRRSECKFKDYECSRCRKSGHLRRMCPQNSATSAARGGGRGSRRGNRGGGQGRGAKSTGATRAHWVEEADVSGDTEKEDEEPIYQMSLSSYKPVSITLSVNNVDLQMEIDTGSPLSCISYKDYIQKF